jgi:hypothetical protein
MKALISGLLIFVLMINGSPVLSSVSPEASAPSAEAQHIYLDNTTDKIILLCDKNDFKKEADEFRDFRTKYGILWTGLIAALTIYAYTRNH